MNPQQLARKRPRGGGRIREEHRNNERRISMSQERKVEGLIVHNRMHVHRRSRVLQDDGLNSNSTNNNNETTSILGNNATEPPVAMGPETPLNQTITGENQTATTTEMSNSTSAPLGGNTTTEAPEGPETPSDQTTTVAKNTTVNQTAATTPITPNINSTLAPSVEGPDYNNSDANETSDNVVGYELETTFTGSNGNNGAMFDVSTDEGDHEIEILSLDVHTNLIQPDCPILVYGRTGTHVGYENTTVGWDLLFNGTVTCLGFGARTELPLFQERAPLLLAGETYAFYTYMPTRSIRYIDGHEVGDIFSSNEFLNIHEGTGVAEFFGGDTKTFIRTRVWNGVVKYLIHGLDDRHDVEGCDTNLTSTYVDNLGSYGNMFDVQTFNNSVEVNGVDFYTDLMEPVTFEIFTRSGPYAEGMYHPDAEPYREEDILNSTNIEINVTNVENMRALNWTLVRRGVTMGRGSGMGTPVRNFVPFTVPANSVQGFYVTLTQPDIRYRDISQDAPNAVVGDTYFIDDDMEIQVGVSVGTYPASQIYYGPRVWSGSIVYTADRNCPSEAPSELPSIAPSMTPSQTPSLAPSVAPSLGLPEFGNCTDTSSLKTTMVGGTGSYGNMFTLTAKDRISITTMEFNAATEDNVLVSVYTKNGDYKGFEEDPSSWQMLAAANVTGSGNGVPTLIPDEAFTDVHMGADDTRAFYVTLASADLKYTRTSTEVGGSLASDGFLSIAAGAGLAAADFGGALFEPRVFNGAVHYRHEDDCVELSTTVVAYNFNIQHDSSVTTFEAIGLANSNVIETVTALVQIDPSLRDFSAVYDLEVTTIDTAVPSGAECSNSQAGGLCTSLETQVTLVHKATLDAGKVLFAMLQHKDAISINLNLLPEFQAEYDGDIPIQTEMLISLGGNFTGGLSDEELLYFQTITQAYLKDHLSRLGVDVLNVDLQSVEGGARLLQRNNDDDEVRPSGGSVDIATTIDGAYRPPPDVDFSAVVEDAIDAEGGANYQDDLRNGRPDIAQEIFGEAGAFQTVTSVAAEAIARPATPLPTMAPTVPPGGSSNAALYGGILGGLAILFLLVVWWYCKCKKKEGDHGELVTMKGTLDEVKRTMFHKKSSKGLFDDDVIEADCGFVSDPYLNEQYPSMCLTETTSGGSAEPGGFQDEWARGPPQTGRPRTGAAGQMSARSLPADMHQYEGSTHSRMSAPLPPRGTMNMMQQRSMRSMADLHRSVGDLNRPTMSLERSMSSMGSVAMRTSSRGLSVESGVVDGRRSVSPAHFSHSGASVQMNHRSMSSMGSAMGDGRRSVSPSQHLAYSNSDLHRSVSSAMGEGRRSVSPRQFYDGHGSFGGQEMLQPKSTAGFDTYEEEDGLLACSHPVQRGGFAPIAHHHEEDASVRSDVGGWHPNSGSPHLHDSFKRDSGGFHPNSGYQHRDERAFHSAAGAYTAYAAGNGDDYYDGAGQHANRVMRPKSPPPPSRGELSTLPTSAYGAGMHDMRGHHSSEW